MSTLLMGLGRQGYRMLELACERNMCPVDVVDTNKAVLEMAERRFGERVRILPGNPLDLNEQERTAFLSRYDMILDALPSFHSYALIRSAIEAGSTVVSVSFLEEDFMALDGAAKEKDALVVPDCGGAPGFSHLMAGYSVRSLGEADRVVMKVGAIPAEPQPPFYHSLTWSVEDLMEEYFRPARCRHDGRIEAPDPFEDVVDEKIQGLPLQSFISDGARSFLTTFPDVPFMEERTLRHYGHMEFMDVLRSAGLLSRTPIRMKRSEVLPYRVLAALLERSFSNLPPEDHFIMQVDVEGKGGRHIHDYRMPYDPHTGVFGLVNSVAVTAIETASMILDGTIQGIGVCPLEILADDTTYRRMAEAHKQVGATVSLSVTAQQES